MNKEMKKEIVDMFTEGIPTGIIAKKYDINESEVINTLEGYGFWI